MPDWSQQLYPYGHLLGRILFAVIFIVAGINHLTRVNATAAYAASKGVPAPKAYAVITGLMTLVGGVLVLLGWHRFIGAGLLVLFLVPVAFLMHGFWKEKDPMMRANEQAHFLKNVALAGAALLVAYYAGGAWPFSLGG